MCINKSYGLFKMMDRVAHNHNIKILVFRNRQICSLSRYDSHPYSLVTCLKKELSLDKSLLYAWYLAR